MTAHTWRFCLPNWTWESTGLVRIAALLLGSSCSSSDCNCICFVELRLARDPFYRPGFGSDERKGPVSNSIRYNIRELVSTTANFGAEHHHLDLSGQEAFYLLRSGPRGLHPGSKYVFYTIDDGVK